LIDNNLTLLTKLTLDLFDRVGVVACEVTIHALLMAAAENRTNQRLFCYWINKFYGKVIFDPEQRVVVEDLQLENKLIVHEVGLLIEC